MALRARLLRRVAELGPAKLTVLRGLARGDDDFDTTFRRMLERGELVTYGRTKGTRYGVPGHRPPRNHRRTP